jgi:hypothetical protein
VSLISQPRQVSQPALLLGCWRLAGFFKSAPFKFISRNDRQNWLQFDKLLYLYCCR